jgi:hypothetical protein
MLTARLTAAPTFLVALLSAAALSGCGGAATSTSAPPPSPPPTPTTLAVTTTALSNGQVGAAYSSALAATGGTAPYHWSVSSGTLPAGLTLSATSGMIAGTPSATAARTPLTFTVTDSSSTAQSKSVTLPLAISPAAITVSISPARAGLVLQQQLSLTATTNDNAGVSWSVSPAGGSFNSGTSFDGAAVSFTAPAAAGVYTLSATSVTDGTDKGSITVGVTDLAGVYTYHNDLARDGANTHEYALTSANLKSASFGKLFSCIVDGAVYAQPLWVASLSAAGAVRNVVYVATQHDSLYAFDADASPCKLLWQVSLIDVSHGALAAGETSVPSGVTGYMVGQGAGSDLTPEVGVTGTPVIDPAGKILYVVSKSANAAHTTIFQRLHAIDLASGQEKSGSPVAIAATFRGDSGVVATFNPGTQNQRPGLAFMNGTVYVAWGSHDDTGIWYGWIIAYSYSGGSFAQSAVLNVTPNSTPGHGGGIWMSGGAPSVDSAGHLYLITGNGDFDVTSPSAPNHDYGDAFLQLTGRLAVSSWFSPTDQATDNATDDDFGSGGSAIVLNQSTGSPQHLVVGGGKDGTLYVLNGDTMGGAGDANAWQHFGIGYAIFSSAAFWNNSLYINPVGAPLLAYAFNSSTKKLTTTPTSQAATMIGFPGATPSVSASGASSNGIVWVIDSANYCTPTTVPTPCAPAVLHAYSATNLATELWNSAAVAADAAGHAVQFTVPTVANGKVYLGTRGNNSGGVFGSTTISGELDVYGLKPD